MVVGQLAVIGGHFVLAVLDNGEEIGVGGADDGGVFEGDNLGHFANRGVAEAVCTVAHLALGFVGVGAGVLGASGEGEGGEAKNEECCEGDFQLVAPDRSGLYFDVRPLWLQFTERGGLDENGVERGLDWSSEESIQRILEIYSDESGR